MVNPYSRPSGIRSKTVIIFYGNTSIMSNAHQTTKSYISLVDYGKNSFRSIYSGNCYNIRHSRHHARTRQ